MGGATTGVALVALVALVLAAAFLWNAYGAFVSGKPMSSFGLAFFTQPNRFSDYVRDGTWGRDLTLRQLAEGGSHQDGEQQTSTLARLALPWSAAALLPTDKASHEGYLEFYEAQLGPLRARLDVRVLEIGVYRGGSLVLWREYLEPDARIFGLDVVDTVPRFPRDDGIRVAIADSTAEAARANCFPEEPYFDVIIDDGCHALDAQLATARNFFPRLAAGGLYVVEDAGGHRDRLATDLEALTGVSWVVQGELVFHSASSSSR